MPRCHGWITGANAGGAAGVGVFITVNCRSKFLMNAEVCGFVRARRGVYAQRWICNNRRAESHLGPLHNNYVSTGHTHTHTHTAIERGPLLFMHDQSIMHFCAFTHRWQDNRITEKRIWSGRICQDCGNSQIPSYTRKKKKKDEEQLRLPFTIQTPKVVKVLYLIVSLSFSEP